jgi:hypothetical protein
MVYIPPFSTPASKSARRGSPVRIVRDGWGTRFVVAGGRETKTEADPPFDFAQGSFFLHPPINFL